MTEEKYQEFLKTAPVDHFSDEFVEFLKQNNKVIKKYWGWLIIRNKKYWTKENDWLTAFYIDSLDSKNNNYLRGVEKLEILCDEYSDREWLIKAPSKRTVKLFHVHLIKKQ